MGFGILGFILRFGKHMLDETMSWLGMGAGSRGGLAIRLEVRGDLAGVLPHPYLKPMPQADQQWVGRA